MADGNLWPEMDSLEYNDWLTKEVHSIREDNQMTKTSFQLLMDAFGNYAPPAGEKTQMPLLQLLALHQNLLLQ